MVLDIQTRGHSPLHPRTKALIRFHGTLATAAMLWLASARTQAHAEQMVLLTADHIFERYQVERVFCGR